MNILLAEDDINIATIAKLSLEQIGKHHVTHVIDGAQALQILEKQEFDLIMLDEMMPQCNGIQVGETLQKQKCQIPIIFMSANTNEKSINAFKHLGKGYIAKPFDPTKLCQMISDILEEDQKRTSHE
ncbi:MAG: response regulator [Bdellovibrio sp.]|nr:MAG: response regulator [Bdellovibrio sp.]